MAESFRERRKRELQESGSQSNSGSSFRERRKKELSGEDYKEYQSNIDTTDLTMQHKPSTFGNAATATTTPVKSVQSVQPEYLKAQPHLGSAQAIQSFQDRTPVKSPKQTFYDQEAEARAKQLKGAPGIIRKPLQALGHVGDVIQANIPGLADFQQGAGNAIGVKAQTAPTTGGFVGGVARGAGTLAGYSVNPAAIEQNLFTGGYKIADSALGTKLGQSVLGATERGLARGANVVNPALNRAGINIGTNLTGKVAERTLRGGIANALQNTALEMDKGHTSGRDILQSAVTGGVFGAAGDVATHAAGSAIGKGLEALRARRASVTPELDAAATQAFNSVQPAQPTKKLGVAYGKLTPASNEQYINKVMGDIKGTVTERMTPPLENPKELAKWLQPHLGDASLNEIRQLPYEDLRQLAEEVRGHLSPYDIARQAAKERGYDLDQLLNNQTPGIKQAADRLRVGRSAGAVEAPQGTVRIATPKTGAPKPVESVDVASSQPAASRIKPDEEELYSKAVKFVNGGGKATVNSLRQEFKIGDAQAQRLIDQMTAEWTARHPAKLAAARPKDPVPTGSQEKPTSQEYTTGKPNLKVVPNAKVDELKFAESVRQSENTSPELAQKLNDEPLTGARTSDKMNQQIAKQMIDKHGVEGLASKLLAKKGKLSPSEVTAAQMLARHFSETGDLDRAIEVVSKTAREGREMGQAIQALSQWNKLDQEGALLLAERQLNRGTTNTEEWTKLTPAQAKPVQTAAKKIEQVQSARSLADEIVSMIANKPEGEALTDAEKALIREFEKQVREVNEQVKPFIKQPKSTARQKVIDEVTKVPPKERTRDQVVNLLDAKAAKARERLKRARNIGFAAVNKGNPVVDYAIIGASHIAKGVVKFADFSEKLVQDFGDSVKPHLKETYVRATNTFRKANGLPTDKELSRVIAAAVKDSKLGEEAAKQTAIDLKAMAAEIGFYLDANLKREAVQDLQLAIKSLDSSTLGEKISTLQTAFQLLSGPTYLRNAIGNVGQIVLEKVSKLSAVPIDWGLSKLTGERTIQFFPQNQEKFWANYGVGTKSGWKEVSPTGTLSSYDVHPNTFGEKNPLRYLTKTLGASLQGIDYAAYRAAYGDVLATYAEQLGKSRGLTKEAIKEQMPELIKQLDQGIQDLADHAGQYATYQDDTLLSMAAQGLKRSLNKITDAPVKAAVERGLLPKKLSTEGFGIGDIVLKYTRTPANLVMRGIDYSPLGFVRGLSELVPLITKSNRGKFNQFQATRALSRAITGTVGLTGLGFALANAGILTGASSPDKDLRSLQEQSGQGAYKVNWSAMGRWIMSGFSKDAAKFQKGDHMMDYAWLQPAAISLGMGVNANEMLKNQKPGEEKRGYELAWDALVGGLRTVLENPMVTGLSNVVDASTDLIRRQDASGFGSLLKGVPASFVPAAVGQLRTSTDNVQRETFDTSLMKEMLNLVANKVPWWSKKLPESYNSLGEPREKIQGGKANTLGQYLNSFVNPTKLTTFDVTPEAKLVLDVLNDSGDSGVLPRVGAKYIMVDDPETKKQKKVDLTKEQFSQLQQSMGQKTMEQLNKNSNYLSSSDRNSDAKVKKIKDILTKVGQQARNEIRVEMGYRKKREG